MSKTSDQIADDIRLKRQALHANVRQLQVRVHSFTDWRQQFERHPVVMGAAAIGAGAILATLAGRTERRRDARGSALASDASVRPQPSTERPQPGLARQVWEPLKAALIDIAVLRLSGLLEGKLPGSRGSPAAHDAPQGHAQPQSGDSHQTEALRSAAERAAARPHPAEADGSVGQNPGEPGPRQPASQDAQPGAAAGTAAQRAGSRMRLD